MILNLKVYQFTQKILHNLKKILVNQKQNRNLTSLLKLGKTKLDQLI